MFVSKMQEIKGVEFICCKHKNHKFYSVSKKYSHLICCAVLTKEQAPASGLLCGFFQGH